MDAHAHHHHHVAKSGRRVKAACTNCKKAKARCDAQRPCSRCVERGCAECVDAFPRRVGRRRNHFFNKIVTESEVKAVQGDVPKKKSRAKRTRKRAKRNTREEERKTPPLAANKRLKTQVPILKLEGAKLDEPASNFSMDLFKIPTQLGVFEAMVPSLDLSSPDLASSMAETSNVPTTAETPDVPTTPKFIFPAETTKMFTSEPITKTEAAIVPAPSTGFDNSDASLVPPKMDRGLSFLDRLDRATSFDSLKPSSPCTDGSCSDTCSSSSCSDLPFHEDIGNFNFLTDEPLSGIGFESDVFDIDLSQNISVAY